MPETTSTAATQSSNGSTLKGFLIGAFTAAAIGGLGFVGGLKFEDIKTNLSTPEATDTVPKMQEQPAEPETIDVTETVIPQAEIDPPLPTQDDLQTMLLSALDSNDEKQAAKAIAMGANPHIILATSAKHVAEHRGAGTTDFIHIQRIVNLFIAGVDPGETLATIAFNPYFKDTLNVIATWDDNGRKHTNAALRITAKNNDLEGFTTLLDKDILGWDAADITADNFAALQTAAENDSTYILQYGLEWDAENNGSMFLYKNGFDLLFDALQNDEALTVDILVDANAHLMIPSYHMQSVFEQSAAGGHLKLYKAMLDDLGMDVTTYAQTDEGLTTHSYAPTLITAAESGYVEIGRAAIAAGAHPSSWKGAPAIRAAIAGHLDFLQMLRQGQKPADFRLQSGEAYVQAVQLGHDRIARFMISEQAELLDIRNGAGFNHAYRTGNIELFKHMLEMGGIAYKNALNEIIDDNNLDFARVIFEHAESLKDGKLPLGTWHAITYRMSDEMAELLDQYADSIKPVLDPNAAQKFLSGPEL